MKISVDASALDAALKTVLRVVSASSASPTLSGVRLVADEGQLTLTGTDLTTTIETAIPATVETTGAAVLPGKLLGTLVSKGTGEASLDTTDTEAKLVLSGVSTNLRTLDITAFPPVPPIQGVATSVDGAVLAAAIRNVSHAVSSDSNRGVLTGILLELSAGTLTLTATDSYRLATDTQPTSSEAEITVVVPPNAMQIFAKAPAEPLLLTASESELGLSQGGVSVRTRLVSGTYPTWRELLKVGSEEISLPGGEILEVLTRVAPTANDLRTVNLAISPSLVTLTTKGEYGSSVGEIPLDGTAHDFEFSVNLDFLVESLKVLGNAVTLHHAEPRRPILLSGEESSTRCLLMPLRSN